MRSPEDSTIRNVPVPGKRVDTVTMMGGNTHEDSILGSDAKRSSDRKRNRGLCGSRLGRSATCDLLASGGLGPSANRGGAATPGRAAGLGARRCLKPAAGPAGGASAATGESADQADPATAQPLESLFPPSPGLGRGARQPASL